MKYSLLNDNWGIWFSFFFFFYTIFDCLPQPRVEFVKVKLCWRICKFMSCFDRTLGHLQLPPRPHTTLGWIYFPSMPACAPLASDAASEHQDEPDGRHFKQADVCSGCFEHRSLGGRDGGRLPTVFNLAATLLAFRADDKEMRDPCVLSHSLNVEFRRYPSTPVQQFTCFLFCFFLYCTLELHFSLC